MIKEFCHDFLENEESRRKKWFDTVIMILILVSTMTFLIGLSSPDLEEDFLLFDEIVLIVFIMEYILRFWVSSDFLDDYLRGYSLFKRRSTVRAVWSGLKIAIIPKLRFMVKPMSIIDLLAILPYFRIFRMFRLLRLLRLLKLIRHSQSVSNLLLVFRDHVFEFGMVVSILLFIIIFSASTIFIIERNVDFGDGSSIDSLGKAFWWSVVTLTSVGYGDTYPQTAIGRVIGAVVMVLGIGICALPAGIIASGLTDRIRKIKEGQVNMKNLKRHIIVCGWTNKTQHMVEELKKASYYRDHDILVISPTANVNYAGIHVLCGDYTKESVLKNANVEKASCAIIVSEEVEGANVESIDARSILTAFLLDKNLSSDANLMVEILRKENAAVLQSRLPKAHIIVSDEISGHLLNNYVLHPGVADLILELIEIERYKNNFYQISVAEIRHMFPQLQSFDDLFSFFREADLGGIPLAVERDKKMIVNPESNFILEKEDHIFYISRNRI